ncbi:SPOR domain-containing protein [Reichenbachiella carrageenanivorans]|uniref:SPOR domain-containing protein n=1 Tax=Reichenbachiella carrageenanivorans TaxID=2979869 RepID=A0ABY6CZF3_9BACT|nr:SPOR domain-containing protein [Reichenbachiella carrageenanivorans]UXX79292.1 SPOR domain-containing protein [Reichenbachiella carrageenanivorans]
MADDKLNEGSEEENKSNQSDEDFGLPDLEFDELQELDFNLDDSDDDESDNEGTLPEPEGIDMSVLDDIDVPESSESADGLQPGDLDPPEGSVLDEGIEEVEDVLDSAQLISDRLGDDDEDPLSPDFSADINYDDLIGEDVDAGSDDVSSIEDMGLDLSSDDLNDTDDLLANIDSPDQLAALGILDEDDQDDTSLGDSSGEGDSLFAADSSSEEDDSIFDTDGMSFDDEKSDFEETDTPSLPPTYKPYSYEESSGGFTKVIVIGVLIISIIGGAFYYFSLEDGPKKVAKKEVPKKTVKKPVAKPVEEVKVEEEPVVKEEKPVVNTPAPTAATANPGEIVQVTARTSRSYVVIASFVDQDLAMDYATELSNEGNGVKIIHPYGKSKRYRVSVADFASYGDAASQLGDFKGQYGDDVWALQY